MCLFNIHFTSRGRSCSLSFRPLPSSVFFGCVRVVTVGVLGSNLRPKLLQETEGKKEARERSENWRQEQVDGVSKRNDGAAGTCPGKNAPSFRCQKCEVEHLWSPCSFSVPASAVAPVCGVSSPPRQRPHSRLKAARGVLLMVWR